MLDAIKEVFKQATDDMSAEDRKSAKLKLFMYQTHVTSDSLIKSAAIKTRRELSGKYPSVNTWRENVKSDATEDYETKY